MGIIALRSTFLSIKLQRHGIATVFYDVQMIPIICMKHQCLETENEITMLFILYNVFMQDDELDYELCFFPIYMHVVIHALNTHIIK